MWLIPRNIKIISWCFYFSKYLSDVHEDHYEAYKKEYGDNQMLIDRKMSRERFVLPENCTFGHIHSKRNEDNIGEIINVALAGVEDANREKLEGVFRDIDFNSETNLGESRDRKSTIEEFD